MRVINSPSWGGVRLPAVAVRAGRRGGAQMKLRLGVGSRRLGGHARAGFLLVALVAFAVVLVPSGSASGPSSGIKQAFVCLAQGTLDAASVPGTCDTSALPGGQTVPLTLTIGNANTSTQSLGSA